MESPKERKTFFAYLLAFLIGFFVVPLVEVLRSSFAPAAFGPDFQLAEENVGMKAFEVR